MPEPAVLIDLDGTLTRTELLPTIARNVGLEAEITELTDATLAGRVPFDVSFRRRVDMLAQVPLDAVHEAILAAPVMEELLALLQQAPERVLVVTGNLDVWVQPWLDRHGLRGLCSHARMEDGRVAGVERILSKDRALAEFPEHHRIAIGDGANDAVMVRGAESGIAWCGVHPAAMSLVEVADYAFASEESLCRFLRRLW